MDKYDDHCSCDCHFTSPDFMHWCEEQYNIGYITGVSGHQKLHEMAAVTIKSAERESENNTNCVGEVYPHISKLVDFKENQYPNPGYGVIRPENQHSGSLLVNLNQLEKPKLWVNELIRLG